MSDAHTPEVRKLSDAGLERRERMLDELLGQVHRVHRGRRRRRRAAVIAIPVMLIMVTIGWRWLPSLHIGKTDPNSIVQIPSENPGSRSDQAIVPHVAIVSVVRTSADVLDRYRASSLPHAHTLTDDELLETLAALDRPAGIIRAGERVWLTRPVIDDPAGGV